MVNNMKNVKDKSIPILAINIPTKDIAIKILIAETNAISIISSDTYFDAPIDKIPNTNENIQKSINFK
jgi:hypothetical protein